MSTGAAIIEIRTTFDSRSAAEACGREVVSERLAACAQVEGPLTSCYRWRGVVESAEEWRCTCKTTGERGPACVAGILARHAYEIPEIIVAEVVASAAYAAWVRECVAVE